MEEEFADIYYVDSRNAVVRDNRDRRPAVAGISGAGWRPRPRPQPLPPTRTVYVPPTYAQPQQVMYPEQVMYPAGVPFHGTAASILGKLTTGQIVEMVAQAFAAIQSLPQAPTATRDIETDVGNMILYQAALATHAKRDEQVRTLGGLVARLVG